MTGKGGTGLLSAARADTAEQGREKKEERGGEGKKRKKGLLNLRFSSFTQLVLIFGLSKATNKEGKKKFILARAS